MSTSVSFVYPTPRPGDVSSRERVQPGWVRFGWAVVLIVIAHVLSTFCWQMLGPATHTIFLAAVVIASLLGGYGAGVLATVLAGIDLVYTFIPPYYSFQLDIDELVFVLSFVAVAFLISSLQERRRTAEASLRKEREGLERRVQERTAELLRSQEQLKTLVNDLVTVSEREQQRIGRDLHDGLGQELTGISLFSSALAERLRSEHQPAGVQAEQVAVLVRQSILYTRDLARGLCPVDLEDEGLATALNRLAERISRLPGVTCTLAAAAVPSFDAGTSIHLYRIAQEAVNNALRHGKASAITMSCDSDTGRWNLTIADNGRGFDPAIKPAGMGRRLMQHRASTIGATLSVENSEQGTRVICSGAIHG